MKKIKYSMETIQSIKMVLNLISVTGIEQANYLVAIANSLDAGEEFEEEEDKGKDPADPERGRE